MNILNALVNNAWTDSAREAARLARSKSNGAKAASGMTGESYHKGKSFAAQALEHADKGSHAEASIAHGNAASFHQKEFSRTGAKQHEQAAKAHIGAMIAHQELIGKKY